MNASVTTASRRTLHHVEIGLLAVLCTLVRLGSVTKTARQLHLSQPAVSHSLARLRTLTGDPLLVQEGRTMVPTAFAVALAAELAPALERIEDLLMDREALPNAPSPGQVFRVGMSDDIQLAVLPGLVTAMRQRAPEARLVVTTVSHATAGADLLDGKTDVALAYLDRLPTGAKVKRLHAINYAVLRGDAIEGSNRQPVTLDEYCRRPHALVTFAGDLRGFIDDVLLQLGRSRRIVCSVSQFASLPSVIAGTDLLVTVPSYLGNVFDALPGLSVDPLPLVGPTFPLSLCWRASTDRDPGHRWLRGELVKLCAECTTGKR